MEQKCRVKLRDKHGPTWGHHVMIPLSISNPFIDKGIKRLICNINNQHEFHCALMPDGNKQYFININREIIKNLKLNIGDELSLILTIDKSKYGMPMPEEFQEILYQDDAVNSIFGKLTPGKQRSLLHIIGKPKSQETRLKKAIVISEYLKDCKGEIDFKDMNQAFKIYNSR